jgi:hypothetical protein
MEQLLASIQIYEGGAVVVLFREASLFEPVRQVRLEKLGVDLNPELPAERRHHADRLASMKRRMQALATETFDDGRPIIRAEDLKGGEFRVHEVAPGVTNYVFTNEAAVDLELLNEIAFASPR